MKDLHPLDVRNPDGGLPTAQEAQPRSLRPAFHKPASRPGKSADGPWGQSDLPAPDHGIAHGSKTAAADPAAVKARTAAQSIATAPPKRRRSRLPVLIFLGLIGYWLYTNFLPADIRNLVRDQINIVTE